MEENSVGMRVLFSEKQKAIDALKKDGSYLEFCSDELREDREIVLTAVKDFPWAIQWLSKELKEDAEILLTAYVEAKKKKEEILDFFPQKIVQEISRANTDKESVLEILANQQRLKRELNSKNDTKAKKLKV